MSTRALWLPEVLRAAGLKVVEVDGWQTRGKEPKDWLCQVFHHTASNRTSGNAPALGICTNGRGGSAPVPGPLCNAVVARDGTWYVIASGAANHPGVSTIPHRGGISSGVKYYALGWECENDGTGEPWPKKQLDSIETGEAAVADRLGWRKDTSEVFGHKEIARPKGRKIDPAGIDMDDHRRRVGARRGPKPPKPIPTEEFTVAQIDTILAAIAKADKDAKARDAAMSKKLDEIAQEERDQKTVLEQEKARRAELLARHWLAQSPVHDAVLIATAQPWDGEMRQRIARHQPHTGRQPTI